MNIPYVWNGIWVGDVAVIAAFLGLAWLLLRVGYRDGYKEAHREAERARRWSDRER